MAQFEDCGWPFAGLVVVTRGEVPATIRCRLPMSVMKATEVAREVAYPLVHLATIVPMVVSWLLFSLAHFFSLFGLFLFLATVVPFFAYLMTLLDARSYQRDAPAFDAELMAFIGNAWALFPLVIAALLGWLQFVIQQNHPPFLSLMLALAVTTVFPASLGVLSITRAPLQGINPVALYNFIRKSGTDYLLLIITLDALWAMLYLWWKSGIAANLLGFGLVYQAFLLYSMTGMVTGRHRLTEQVDIPAPLAATAGQSRGALLKERQKIANHAYGFVSRGNRAGGLAHIQSRIDGEVDQDDACHWFFNEMLKWESPDTALFFAQSYLRRLLQQQDDAQALKLLSQCFHFNPRFKPARDDRDAARALAEGHGRRDLLNLLG